MSSSSPGRGEFQVLLPVKSLDTAKSRLELTDAGRRSLALAFLLDTLRAAAECRLVGDLVVVTRDQQVTDVVREGGASVVVPGDARGLNGELAQVLAERLPGGRPTTILMPDLPSVTAHELEEALTLGRREHRPTYVEDLSDGGTTMLTSRRGDLVPAFGARSAARHRSAGARPVGGELVGARCDVDDLESLRMAVYIGVGPHTRQALERLPGLSALGEMAHP
ncbi:2-phospho-L-lactate guanylyltransferase [Nocardioides sp. LMS-CY]|uniref:2-phospho-L-lactate guanylyltransferase n=1 Tax=Nocardioides soli TaxID=1036020 RepID=A0A7W4Z3B8_9ACTN|nr:2-phospho-L-lactate guanylyltransferase [Nocardioides sp. LMS-CY]MBB3045334.1 2-phospho-L-lactate guanylyltransferase [Nocardioides soli]QWF22116.1 2-phospho-L-lactate guanylyltransferase [Nocardioides sp. LMS-CY]